MDLEVDVTQGSHALLAHGVDFFDATKLYERTVACGVLL